MSKLKLTVNEEKTARSCLFRMLHLEDSKGTGSRQIVLERDFPKMGIGDVEVPATDRKTVRPGQFRRVADEDFRAQFVIGRHGEGNDRALFKIAAVKRAAGIHDQPAAQHGTAETFDLP